MSKNIVITGTSSGIGLELTKFFIKNKHHVLAISRNNSDLRNLNLKGLYAVDFDITNFQKYDLLNKHLNNFENVDVLINNAGLLIKAFCRNIIGRFSESILYKCFLCRHVN